MFEKNDLVSLNDNKEYLIIDIVVIDEKKYIYLMDINDNKNFIVGLLNEENQVSELTDQNMIEKVFDAIKKKNNL